MTLRQLRVWDEHRRQIEAGEQLDAVWAQSVPWMDAPDRADEVRDLQRRASGARGGEDAGGRRPRDGFDRVSLEQFRADIGARRKR